MDGVTAERDEHDERDPDENGWEGALQRLSHLKDPVPLSLYRSASASRYGVTRDEAARAAGISRSLAAYHLDKLVEAELLEARFERRTGRRGPGAGRPAKIYVPSGRQLHVSVPPRDYELAAQLLAEALDSDRDAPPRAALRERARILGGSIGVEARRRCGDDGVVECLHDVLAGRGYEPYDDDGAMRLRNCPFQTLSAQHRDLVCGMNLAILEGMVDASGAEDISARLDPRPGECCVVFEPNRADA